VCICVVLCWLQVLAGVQLVFSRVIPLETNPRQHPLWVLAEQYGATCSQQCTPDTTHVVAMNQGTESGYADSSFLLHLANIAAQAPSTCKGRYSKVL
jgi:hypothetical protein